MEKVPNTPRGPAYRERYAGQAQEKLFIPRTRNGNPDYEILNMARKLESSLEKQQWFVGLAPHGSRMKGTSEKDSDLDFALFYDATKSEVTRDGIKKQLQRASNALVLGTGKEAHLFLYPLDPTLIQESLDTFVSKGNVDDGKSGLGYLCGAVIGPRVAAYRSLVAEAIRNYPTQKDRETAIRAIAHEAALPERWRASKMKQRVRQSAKQEHDILAEREKMWEKRVRDVLGFNE